VVVVVVVVVLLPLLVGQREVQIQLLWRTK
jgi:hypothetical protein